MGMLDFLNALMILWRGFELQFTWKFNFWGWLDDLVCRGLRTIKSDGVIVLSRFESLL